MTIKVDNPVSLQVIAKHYHMSFRQLMWIQYNNRDLYKKYLQDYYKNKS